MKEFGGEDDLLVVFYSGYGELEHRERSPQPTCFEKHHDIYILVSLATCSFKEILAPVAGVRCAEAVRNCIIKRKWKGLEDWESQNLV